MWPLATSAFVVYLVGLLLLGAHRHALRHQPSLRRAELLACLVVAVLTLGGFAFAHAGMNYSWTGELLVTDWSWLALAVLFVGALLAACSLLRLQRPAPDQWLLPAVAALAALGLVHVYIWEARDANAYVSTVALPEMRRLEKSVAGDLSLDEGARSNLRRVLGSVPNELDFERGPLGPATVLNPKWLRAYNQSVGSLREGLGALPPAQASRFVAPREVDLFPATERQLLAAILGLLLVPAVSTLVARLAPSSLSRNPGALAALALAPLLLVGVAAAARGGQRLPAALPLGFQDISAYEVAKLGVVLSLALGLGQVGRGRRALPNIAVLAALLGTGAAVLGLSVLDAGAGAALFLVGGVMAAMVMGRRGRGFLLAGVVLAALVTPGAALFLGDSLPQSVRVRLEMWSDPSGTFERSEIRNAASAVLGRIVEARAGQPPVRLASTRAPEPSEPLTSAVDLDVGHLIQELAYRLDVFDGEPGPAAAPFIPEPDPLEEGVLAEADDLWSRFGATGAADGGWEEARQRIDALVFEIRQALTELTERSFQEADRAEASGGGGVAEPATSETHLLLPDPEPDNFQLQRAHFGLRAGGPLGVGLGLGRPEAVPGLAEDAALAAVGESLGLAGTAVVLLLVAALCLRGLEWAAARSSGPEGLLMAGLSVLLLVHAVLSAGGLTGVLPFTGLTFPFISRGGTSLVSNLVLIGIMLGLSAHGRTAGATQVQRVAVAGSPGAAGAGLLRWGIAAAIVPLVLALSLVQLGGWSLAPGVALGGLGETDYPAGAARDQWQAPPYRQAPGAITDRHGVVLAETRSLESGRTYPDAALATSLAHTLAQLDMAISSGDLKPATLSARRTSGHRELVGPTLVTTIDAGLQLALDHAMTDGAREAGLPDRPPRRGAAIALDATTGEILALVSRPTFSPEELNDLSLWAADEAADRRDGFVGRRLNRAIHGYYPPGSIFKTLTAAAVLEEGMNPTFDYRSGEKGPRPPDGLLQLGTWHRIDMPQGSPITCGNHPPEEDWRLDLTEAFAWSCNVAFAELGMAVGAEGLVGIARRFGFEEEITVPGLGSFTSTLDREPDKPVPQRFLAQDQGNVARTAFGQGQTQATPLQMALVPAAIANWGVIMQPYVVAGWLDPSDDGWIDQVRPRPRFYTLLSPKTLGAMERMMLLSTTYGWARGAKLNEFNENPGVAGKTGSAEWSDEIDAPHAWFIGYFPVEQPRIALAVVVERGGMGPTVAVRIAHHFLASEAVAAYLEEVAP